VAEPQATGVPDGWDIVTPPPPKAAAPERQGFGQRVVAAVGPAIRGVGDVTGANRLLEATGAVAPGRLTGDEGNDRDAATRTGAEWAAGGAMATEAVTGLVKLAKQGGVSAAIRGAAAMTVAPQIKYQLTLSVLHALGIPNTAAMPVALAVSNIRLGKGAAPEAPMLSGEKPPVPMEAPRDLTNRLRAENFAKAGGQDAARAEMSAALEAHQAEMAARTAAPPETVGGGTPPPSGPPAAPASPAAQTLTGPPPPAEVAPAAAPKFPTQKALNELALAARRAKVTLTPDTERAGLELMQQGASAESVVANVQRMQAVKDRIPAADVSAYLKLRQAGKTDAEATSAIAAMRSLRSRFSLPTADDVKSTFQQLYERGQKTAPHE